MKAKFQPFVAGTNGTAGVFRDFSAALLVAIHSRFIFLF